MVHFEHGPIFWSVSAGTKAAIQCTGEKNRCNKTAKLFLKIALFPASLLRQGAGSGALI
jgi:hypothetical protein